MGILLTFQLQRFDKTIARQRFMHWRKMKIHLKHWANSLEEEGYHADAKYVREELMSKIDNDLPIYNERGKQKLLELFDKLNEVKQNR